MPDTNTDHLSGAEDEFIKTEVAALRTKPVFVEVTAPEALEGISERIQRAVSRQVREAWGEPRG